MAVLQRHPHVCADLRTRFQHILGARAEADPVAVLVVLCAPRVSVNLALVDAHVVPCAPRLIDVPYPKLE